MGSITMASATLPAKPLCTRPETSSANTKIPVTMVGTPFRMSRAKRTARAIQGGAN